MRAIARASWRKRSTPRGVAFTIALERSLWRRSDRVVYRAHGRLPPSSGAEPCQDLERAEAGSRGEPHDGFDWEYSDLIRETATTIEGSNPRGTA